VNNDKHIGTDFEVVSVKLAQANVSNNLFTKIKVTLVTVMNV
jgi:hypothetical protein